MKTKVLWSRGGIKRRDGMHFFQEKRDGQTAGRIFFFKKAHHGLVGCHQHKNNRIWDALVWIQDAPFALQQTYYIIDWSSNFRWRQSCWIRKNEGKDLSSVSSWSIFCILVFFQNNGSILKNSRFLPEEYGGSMSCWLSRMCFVIRGERIRHTSRFVREQ